MEIKSINYTKNIILICWCSYCCQNRDLNPKIQDFSTLLTFIDPNLLQFQKKNPSKIASKLHKIVKSLHDRRILKYSEIFYMGQF